LVYLVFLGSCLGFLRVLEMLVWVDLSILSISLFHEVLGGSWSCALGIRLCCSISDSNVSLNFSHCFCEVWSVSKILLDLVGLGGFVPWRIWFISNVHVAMAWSLLDIRLDVIMSASKRFQFSSREIHM
jgi:hypothetical protein